ncbi:MAG TPA: hypothetical protein VMH01_11630 [Puia sp.]|nr:hypothetical protein [Puia sp.]
MENHLKKSYSFLLIGFGLINIISFTLVLMAMSFSTGLTLSFWHFPLAVTLSLLANFLTARFFLKDQGITVFRNTGLAVLIITVISIFIAVSFYDISSDGQMYHLEATYQFKTGWNPFRTQLPYDFSQALWLNHYGKGTEAPQAAIYAVTNKIESGKATNFMLLVASFFMMLAFLYRLNRFSLKKKLFISALFSLNPVVVYQLISTYVDGQLASLLLCLLLICCFLFIDTNRAYLFLLASMLVIMVNIKFTAIVFAGVFLFAFLAILLLNKKKIEARRVFFTCATAVILGIGFVGYYPYVTNTIDHHDPIYPGLDILQLEASKQYPKSFQSKSRFGRFFTSLFTHTDNMKLYLDSNPPVPLKLPFTFNKTDIKNACKPYVVIMAGMGPFFSGAVILALIFYIVLAIDLRDRRLFRNITLLLLTMLFSVFIISEAWWARYVPQLWLIPVTVAFLTEFVDIKWVNRLRFFFYVVVAINILLSFGCFPFNFYKTTQINYELAQLKASHQVIPVEWTYQASNRIRFYENNIPFKEQHLEGDSVLYMVSSSSKFIPPKNMPDVPKPFLLKWGQELEKKFKK